MNKVYKISFPNGKCYIGVTSTLLQQRFAAHKHAKYAVGSAIRKYGSTIKDMNIIFSGTEQDCYKIEAAIVNQRWVDSGMNYNLCLGGVKPPGVSLKGSKNPMWKGGSYCIKCGTQTYAIMCQSCRNKARENINYCACGCGKHTSRPEYEYVRGHKPRLGRVCRCGCGQRTDSRSRYRIQGH